MSLETAIAAAEAAETDYTDLLTDTCTIRRATMGTTRDPYGNFVPTWANLATGVVCRLDEAGGPWSAAGRETYTDKNITVADYMLCLKWDQDITERDRVTAVVRDGITVVNNECEVILVSLAAGEVHHKEALLARVKV